mmetsp:Transcript_25049/g.40412  ORF Transcript_25049/g.40412 Transcript_25049/m.40412 type:complete len:525 (+) Transcript_25049:27-1601(+)
MGPLLISVGLLALSSHAIHQEATKGPPMWPHPFSYQNGSEVVSVSPFLSIGLDLETNDITAAFDRFKKITFQHRVPKTNLVGQKIAKVVITAKDANAPIQLETDESYSLSVPSDPNQAINITAATQVGVMHALQTLSQLIIFDYSAKDYKVQGAPWEIVDKPRFKHREVLIDTARHFEPVSQLYRILDSMTYAKINVMHWHLTDSQSFPFDSPSYPRLSEMGAYSSRERYSIEDVEDVIEYARARGIRAVVEIDTPGHAAAMCAGHPEICPSATCLQPLNPASNETLAVLSGLFNDLTGGVRGKGLFFDNMMHLGGDEVNTDCWTKTPSVANWLKAKNMTTDDAYLYLVAQAQEIAHSQGRDVIGWEEIWNHFGTKLGKSTIIQQWLPGSKAAKEAVEQGYRVIWSTDGVWYLDGLKVTWETMYQQEPCDGIDADKCAKYVIGGGGEMWGETADASDVLQTIWPRLAAISERLWSPRTVNNTDAAQPRITAFRCLLNARGIPAAPVTNDVAREGPQEPGSCYAQ